MSMFSKVSALLLPATDLWRAAKLGDVPRIRQLVALGADANAKKRTLNIEGETPLHFAARHDQPNAIRALVELGANIDLKDDHGDTPLAEAVAHGASSSTIELIMALGA